MNVLEEEETNTQVGGTLKHICEQLEIPLLFEHSFDKANRSSISSYRGPGLQAGLRQLEELRRQLQVPVITDIHEPWQAEPVAQVVDVLQIPAFLCRQTDLLQAAANTGRPLHIKKMQIVAPRELHNVLEKMPCTEFRSGLAV